MNTCKKELMVTIRCLAYNHEPYIRQCLEGFVMQKTNFRFEAIVHDDASTDGTAAIIKEYAEKYPEIIKPIFETENQYSKRDGSLKRIMNEHTHGKYLALCEGDDYWIDPLKLQKQVDFLESNLEYVMSHTSIDYLFMNVNRIIHYRDIEINTPLNVGGRVLPDDILTKYKIQTLSVVIRTNIYKKVIDSDEILYKSGYFLMGDTQLWFGLAQLGKIHFLPEVTAIYRRNPDSVSNQTNIKKQKRFSLSSAELRYYISLNYDLKKETKKLFRKKYERALILYWKYDSNFIPKFPINIKYKFVKTIQFRMEDLFLNVLRKIFGKLRRKFQKKL